MPKPLNKAQLLGAIEKNYTALEQCLAPLTREQMAQAPNGGGWAIKDFLAHLYEWQQMFFTWYESGRRGETPAPPALGYKWNQLPALNQRIYEKYCTLPAEQALALFHGSHQQTVAFIQALPEHDLITPG